jgi:Clp amino terminal domain, pathogenicity island component
VTATVRFTEEAGIVPHFAREEAERRHQYYLGPEHLLLGLLVGDENPMFGLPDRGPSPVRLLVESHGLTLGQLRAAVLEELDRSEG